MHYTTKILKMGNKIGIYLGNKYEKIFKIKKGEPIEMIIQYKSKEIALITRMNYNIVLRKSLMRNLESGTNIRLKIRKVRNLKRTRNIFYRNKIDILSLIPVKTSKEYEIILTQFDKNKDKWLRIWYSHKRGSGRQFEIKRYTDIESFASMLGQFQAEGTKKESLVEFTNTLVSEHKDFAKSIKLLGIDNIEFFQSKKAYRTVVRYSALASILLNSMNTIRETIAKKELKGNLRIAADSFFSKLLIGDGTIDIGKRKVPQISIKIVDCNRKYLQDYKEIMKKLGFKPHINQKRIWVKSSCSFENMIYLYNIKAFRNSNNWNKLIIAIKMLLEGRRISTFYRFLHLRNHDNFTSLDIKELYNVGLRTANDWILNCINNGYVQRIEDSKPIKYGLTEKATDLARTLKEIDTEFMKIKKNKGSANLCDLLDSFKLRNQPKSAPI